MADVGRIGDISEGVKQDKLDFEITKSSALSFEGALLAGAIGGVTPMANIVGEQLCKIYELTLKNRISSAVDIQLKLDQTDRLLGLRYLGVAGLKAVMDLVGVYGGPCRLPIQPLPPQELKRIRDKMVEDGIL